MLQTQQRPKTIIFQKMMDRYKDLKKEIFGESMLCIVNENENFKEYNELFQFFYPSFRTNSFDSKSLIKKYS